MVDIVSSLAFPRKEYQVEAGMCLGKLFTFAVSSLQAIHVQENLITSVEESLLSFRNMLSLKQISLNTLVNMKEVSNKLLVQGVTQGVIASYAQSSIIIGIE